MVNGTRVPYVRSSRYEASRASKLLTAACGFPVRVVGLVVPVGADTLTVKTPPCDVHIVARRQLQAFLTQLPPTELTGQQLEALTPQPADRAPGARRRRGDWRRRGAPNSSRPHAVAASPSGPPS